MAQTPKYGHFINGSFHQDKDVKYRKIFNPATGETIAEVALGTKKDLDFAVESARVAFEDPKWRYMPVAERSILLLTIVEKLQQHAPELIALEAMQSGGTVSRILNVDIPFVLDLAMHLSEELKSYQFSEFLPSKFFPEHSDAYIIKEPLGVCGLITAWNFPILLLLWKLLPAIATGNTVVVKPADNTPLTSLKIAEVLSSILPKGVFNVVTGDGEVVGHEMSIHKDINKISFTGSTRVGKLIQKNAADTLKKVTLELGGKGPAIVLADADLDLVAKGALFGCMLNAGQACESGTRLLVHESIYNELTTKLVTTAKSLSLGNPLDFNTAVGPIASEKQFNSIMNHIDSLKKEGATIALGGTRKEVQGCENGYFVNPTIVTGVNNKMQAAREEIFGPVLVLIPFKTEEEAIKIANDTDYGLSAGIWSKDICKAKILSNSLNAGSIWINDWHMLRSDAPFGGYKASGYGREMGKHSFEGYLQTKVVNTAFQRDADKKPFYAILHKKELN